MREIRKIGTLQLNSDTVKYTYSLFECSFCKKETLKKRKDGIKADFCSHECYAQNRTKRGGYNDYVIISGYKYVICHEHPNKNKKSYVALHRLVAEKKIGRYLKDDEVVHHINENKLDNRSYNLQVMTNSEHIKLHKTKAKRKSNGEFK